MAQYRLAVLIGKGAQLCTYKIHSYQTITAFNYKVAKKVATREGALITGWRGVK